MGPDPHSADGSQLCSHVQMPVAAAYRCRSQPFTDTACSCSTTGFQTGFVTCSSYTSSFTLLKRRDQQRPYYWLLLRCSCCQGDHCSDHNACWNAHHQLAVAPLRCTKLTITAVLGLNGIQQGVLWWSFRICWPCVCGDNWPVVFVETIDHRN